MHIVALIAGIGCIFAALMDAFQTIILPRRAAGPVHLTRWFYIVTWYPWASVASRISKPRARETAFSFYGPLSLIVLLAVWAAALLVGFALIYYSVGSPFNDLRRNADFWSDLYVSGTTVFTLGLGDVTPHSPTARWLIIVESGTGLGLLAVVMGYFPVLYGAFSRREVSISLLDARAGSPPTAAELMRRHAHEDASEALSILLTEWERWSAELLESHISFPLLCFFRSQHTNQSWLSALTCILDASALLIAGVQGHEARQAQLTFAMARHAMVDLTQVLTTRLIEDSEDRLPQAKYDRLYALLCGSGVSMCRDDRSQERLRELRRLYEPYAVTLSRHFCMPLPPWISDETRKDNWLTVAKVRANAEAANPVPPAGGDAQAHTLESLHDAHHEF